QKYPNFLTKISSILVLLLYIEVSITIYGLLIGFIGILESILISLSILLFLTLLDIYSIKKVKKGYASLVHSISFFSISLMLFLILNRLISQYPLLLSVEVFIFLIMQFYTNYSLFASLKDLSPSKKDILNKVQIYIKHLLGVGFYITLCGFILQSLVLQKIELQLIFLILSALIHVLMIVDSFLLKFIGKTSNYIRVISWIFIMTFTATYLIWLYSAYFITFFFTVIPIIISILILEIAYLFRLLNFWTLIISKKERIRFYLINLTYLNFITWPLYFASLNAFLFLNLILASILITFLIANIDDIIGVLKEKVRISLKSYSFLIFGSLLAIDIFIVLGFIPHFDLLLNISISALLFIIFLIVKVKPFKEHSIVAFGFWMIIFLLFSLFIYRISLSWIFGVTVLGLTILIYPFVFLLEELRELFNKFIDNLLNLFRMIKNLVKNIIIKIGNFIKLYFKSILLILNAILAIFLGVLLSPALLDILNWIHSMLLIFPFFGLFYSFIPSKKSEDVDITFRRHMFRLIISWGSIIIVLFAFITPIWYIFTIWISIWIIGAILLPYISFKEKNENISIKWRFYTLIILIVLLILFGILFSTQIYMNFFLNL
ncbi:MAG: hypothetical protein ACFFBK_07720, partial [Promethearchaeota archaeon]